MASTSSSFCSSAIRTRTINNSRQKNQSAVNFESYYNRKPENKKFPNKLGYKCYKSNTKKEILYLSLTRCELLSPDVSKLYLTLSNSKSVQPSQNSLRWLVARLFDPAELDPSKLTVNFMDALNPSDVAKPSQLIPRRYTLTHNDLTAEVYLTIGSNWNKKQLEGWYTRLLRDEIIAEWRIHGEYQDRLSLHIFCHVSGSHSLMLPAPVRNWIFKREMPLVLKAIMIGDKDFLGAYPELEAATVWVHYQSCQSEFNRADCLGPLIFAVNRNSKQLPTQILSLSQNTNLHLNIVSGSSKFNRDITSPPSKLPSLRSSMDPVLCLNELPSTQLPNQAKKVSLTKRERAEL